jgi:hypothetical protein
MTRRMSVIWVVGLAIVLVAAAGLLGTRLLAPSPTAVPPAPVDLSPRVASRAAGGDPSWVARMPAVRRTRALVDVDAHATPGGPAQPIFGSTAIERGQDLAVLGDPTVVDGTPWLRVYVLPLTSGAGPDDFFTWIPATDGTHATIGEGTVVTCPDEAGDLASLAGLDPFSRLRCQGAASFTLRGRSWGGVLPVWYSTQPGWFGGPNGPGPLPFSLHAGAIQRERNAGEAARFLDVHVPPGLEPPPPDMTVEAVVHFADGEAATCARSDTNQMVPPEAGADSALWCATQLVVERWTPVLGPEDRPFDSSSPQLHRFQPFGFCGGVGMGPLVFHVAPSQLDPVWLERTTGGAPIVAWFGPQFRVAFAPDLVVLDGAGRVVARDGLPVNPDADLAGHHLCPTSDGVYID